MSKAEAFPLADRNMGVRGELSVSEASRRKEPESGLGDWFCKDADDHVAVLKGSWAIGFKESWYEPEVDGGGGG
jgi:sugar lactone lactonase YvrE